jgi:putative transposase
MSNLEYNVLLGIKSRHQTGQQIAKRIRILLYAKEGKSHSWIQKDLGVSVNTIKKWRRKWSSFRENQGKSENAKDLENHILGFLQDLPRSGTPNKFTVSQQQQIVALACDKPERHGLAVTNWTHERLAETAASKGIVLKISSRQVGRILKNTPIATT